jgi:mannose-6-phosphate isomerase
LADGRSLREHCGELPYLLKILAADAALSLQTHPSRAQAEAGFDREDAAGIALDAPERIYRDRSPKPELLCALTSFDALCGFRPVRATVDLCDELGLLTLSASLRDQGLAATVDALYRGHLDPAPIIEVCAMREAPEATLVTQLAEQYPGDPSVVVTLLLNRVTLSPGEALGALVVFAAFMLLCSVGKEAAVGRWRAARERRCDSAPEAIYNLPP